MAMLRVEICEANGSFMHWSWDPKMIQPLWKQFNGYLKVKWILYISAISILGNLLKSNALNIHRKTWIWIMESWFILAKNCELVKYFINWWIDRQIVIKNRILLRKKWMTRVQNNMNGSPKHYAKEKADKN